MVVWVGWESYKSNLLKIPDCRLFSVFKTLTGLYRLYSHSEKENTESLHCLDEIQALFLIKQYSK